MWVSEMLRADGRTLRTRFAAELRQRVRNCEVDAQRICTVAFGRGRTAPGPRGRVGLPRVAACDVIEVGEFVWRDNCVCEVIGRRADGALVRVREMMIADMAASASVHAFGGADTQLAYYTEAPLWIDTASRDTDDVVHVEVDEVGMLRDVAARAASGAKTSTGGSDWTPYGRVLVGDAANGTTTDIATDGILDFDCVAEAHQIFPWGSQYRNVVSREGHAWILADLARDPQVAAAAALAELHLPACRLLARPVHHPRYPKPGIASLVIATALWVARAPLTLVCRLAPPASSRVSRVARHHDGDDSLNSRAIRGCFSACASSVVDLRLLRSSSRRCGGSLARLSRSRVGSRLPCRLASVASLVVTTAMVRCVLAPLAGAPQRVPLAPSIFGRFARHRDGAVDRSRASRAHMSARASRAAPCLSRCSSSRRR